MTQKINDEAVYRTAPATPGLLIFLAGVNLLLPLYNVGCKKKLVTFSHFFVCKSSWKLGASVIFEF